MKRFFLFSILLTLITLPSIAQKDAVEKIIAAGTTDNRVMHHLDVLTNRFGGRPVGSNAYDNAAQWVASEFRRWGLEVEMHEAGSVPVGFNRGPWFGRMLGGDEAMTLHFVTPSYTAGTRGLQRGHVLSEPRTQEEFDRMRHALKGAWVLISGRSSGWAIDQSQQADSVRESIIEQNLVNEKINAEIRRRNRENETNDSLLPIIEHPALFLAKMREAGILGIIQSAPVPLTALYDRNLVNDSTMTFDRLPTLPDIKLDEHQYATVKQMVEERRGF